MAKLPSMANFVHQGPAWKKQVTGAGHSPGIGIGGIPGIPGMGMRPPNCPKLGGGIPPGGIIPGGGIPPGGIPPGGGMPMGGCIIPPGGGSRPWPGVMFIRGGMPIPGPGPPRSAPGGCDAGGVDWDRVVGVAGVVVVSERQRTRHGYGLRI